MNVRISPSGRFATPADFAPVDGAPQLIGTSNGSAFSAFDISQVGDSSSEPCTANAIVDPGAYSNYGATGAVTLTLGTVSSGSRYRFTVLSAYSLVVQAPAGTTIRVGTQVSSSGGTISSNVIGACVQLIAESDGVFVATAAMQVW